MPLRGGFRHAALVAALALAVTACGGGGDQAATDAAAKPAAPAAAVAQPPAQVISAQVAAMSVDQLRTAARAAQNEQRMYAPAGNNAMEYYLALRDKQPNDAAVISALTDLMPYTVIATEESIARDDFSEALRLYALMEKTDKSAPALPRLKQAITDAQTSFAQRQQQQQLDAEAEKERQAKLEEDRKKQQEEDQKKAAQQIAQQAETARQAEATRQAETARQAEAARLAEAARQEEERRKKEAAASTTRVAAPAAASASDLRLISAPPAKYPTDAFRDRQSGEVEVEFTVGTDGSVTSARAVRGTPPRVFEREAVNAVKRWRFQPVAAPVTTRRVIAFKP